MKQTFKGWAGKSGMWWFNKDKESRELMVFRTRGKRVEWDDDDWPPVRVKVTIETLPNAEHHPRAVASRGGCSCSQSKSTERVL